MTLNSEGVGGRKMIGSVNQSLAFVPPSSLTPPVPTFTFISRQITRQRQIDKDLKQTATEIKAAQADKQVTSTIRAGVGLCQQVCRLLIGRHVLGRPCLSAPGLRDVDLFA